PGDRRALGRDRRRRRRLPLPPGRFGSRRAVAADPTGGARCRGESRIPRARGASGTRRPARARPPGRGPDPRPDDARGPPGSPRGAPAGRLKLAVAGTAPLGADVLERLADGHEIEYLLTRPDRPRG